jgi:phage shock protein C
VASPPTGEEVAMEKRLYRSKDERLIWGICGGIAKYFGVDPVLIRVIAVASIIFGGWGILAYIILYFVVPLEPE